MKASFAILLLLSAFAIAAAQPLNAVNSIEFDTQSEPRRRAQIKHTGFVFDFFTGKKSDVSANGFAVGANADSNAFTHTLGEHGNALNLINLGPCSGNTPHTHPRGAEISSVVRGTIQFGFVEENGGQNRLVVVDASAGQVVFIPQGLMHFSHNLDCTPAAFIANFGNRDPGTQTIWASLMAIPTPILAASLNIHDSQAVSESIINGWKQRQLVAAPATGGAECLKRCHINYKEANAFSASPAVRAKDALLGPIIPTDQLGNPQNFTGGHITNPSARCDFLGISQLPATPGPATCPKDIPITKPCTTRRLQELEATLPQDRITVLDAAALE